MYYLSSPINHLDVPWPIKMLILFSIVGYAFVFIFHIFNWYRNDDMPGNPFKGFGKLIKQNHT